MVAFWGFIFRTSLTMTIQTPEQKTKNIKPTLNDRTGVWENRTKFNQEQARIINDGIYWMEKEIWNKELEEPTGTTHHTVCWSFHFFGLRKFERFSSFLYFENLRSFWSIHFIKSHVDCESDTWRVRETQGRPIWRNSSWRRATRRYGPTTSGGLYDTTIGISERGFIFHFSSCCGFYKQFLNEFTNLN